MIAYDVQKAGRVSIDVLKIKRSTITAIAKAVMAISE
jgi:hypothetical protein